VATIRFDGAGHGPPALRPLRPSVLLCAVRSSLRRRPGVRWKASRAAAGGPSHLEVPLFRPAVHGKVSRRRCGFFRCAGFSVQGACGIRQRSCAPPSMSSFGCFVRVNFSLGGFCFSVFRSLTSCGGLCAPGPGEPPQRSCVILALCACCFPLLFSLLLIAARTLQAGSRITREARRFSSRQFFTADVAPRPPRPAGTPPPPRVMI